MDNNGFAFVDLFAGIGGLRRAMDGIGGRCVFTSEWDRFAQKTYAENYRDNHPIAGDITKIDAADIPEHDVLCAGFPCQPFSIAGVSKKNALGRAHGFEDETQGTLFYDVVRILKHHRPAAFLLENVKTCGAMIVARPTLSSKALFLNWATRSMILSSTPDIFCHNTASVSSSWVSSRTPGSASTI